MVTLDDMDVLWAVRRLPAPVRDLMKEAGAKMFLAGGYLRASVANEKASDIDLFCGNAVEAKAYAALLAQQVKQKAHETVNAVTVKTKPIPTQFIHRWTFLSPADALASFDFTIAQAALWYDANETAWRSACSPRFYSDLAGKRLAYTCPTRQEEAGGSMLRVLKFYQRGYRIPLDSLGAVMARCARGVEQVDRVIDEGPLATIITGLLREVDPAIDPDHLAHLPALTEPERP
jgi:hypothetical protein